MLVRWRICANLTGEVVHTSRRLAGRCLTLEARAFTCGQDDKQRYGRADASSMDGDETAEHPVVAGSPLCTRTFCTG
jgi:hypothetical protein